MPKRYTIIVHNCAECPESVSVEYGSGLACFATEPIGTCPDGGIPDWCPLEDEEAELNGAWSAELNCWITIGNGYIYIYEDQTRKKLISAYPLFTGAGMGRDGN